MMETSQMMEQSVLMEWVYVLLWIFAGAYSVSLGTTAGYRITGFHAQGRDNEQYYGLIGDNVFHILGRVVISMLWRSRCDNCNKFLPNCAAHPLWGAWVTCLDLDCTFSRYKTSWYERLKYFVSELLGGISLAIVWCVLGKYMHNMLVMMLLIFLCFFLISIKNRVHQTAEHRANEYQGFEGQMSTEAQGDTHGESGGGTPKVPGIQRDAELSAHGAGDGIATEADKDLLSQMHAILATGIGLAIIGRALPIETNYQYLGMAILGWVGWWAGTLQVLPQGSGIVSSDDKHALIPVRSIVCGLIAGAWFGVILGAIVCIPVFGGLLCRRRCRKQYIEECLLLTGALTLVGLVYMSHLEIDSGFLSTVRSEFLRATGVMKDKFDVSSWMQL